MSSPLGIPGLQAPDLIGRGGFGTVYRVEEPEFGREVAVKVISDRVGDDDVRRAFVRECQAMGALSGHPHIITVHRGGTTELGEPYIVMDLMDGGSLADRLDRDGPLPWPEVLEIGVAVAGALETAHRAGILHLDVKPANILVSRFGEPKLADFGISRLPGVTATSDGRIRASIAYAAPERLLDGTAVPASDLYALGGALYALLVGQPAFGTRSGEDVLAAIGRIVREPVPDLRGSDVPDPVAHVVERLLAKSPVDRFASASDAAFALQAAQRATGRAVTRAVIEGAPPLRADTRTWPMLPPGRWALRTAEEEQRRWDSDPSVEVRPLDDRVVREADLGVDRWADSPVAAGFAAGESGAGPARVPPGRRSAGSVVADRPSGRSDPERSAGTGATVGAAPALDPAGTEPGRADGPPPAAGGPGRPSGGGRRRLVVAASVATALVLAGGGGALLLLDDAAKPTPVVPIAAPVTTTTAPAPAPTSTPPPPLQIAVATSVTHPDRAAVAARLDAYFTAINERRYEDAFAAFSPESSVAGKGLASFRAGYTTTTVVRQRIIAITDLDGDAVRATVTYRSTQDASIGPSGSTCTNWSLAYDLTGPELLIRRARAVNPPKAC